MCDAICDMTGATQGVVLLGSVRGPQRGSEKNLAMLIFLVSELGGLKVEVS